jgi:hypothetical protein
MRAAATPRRHQEAEVQIGLSSIGHGDKFVETLDEEEDDAVEEESA